MEGYDDGKDLGFGNNMPKELGQSLANGTKFVDEVLNGPTDRCLENFRMDKQAFYKLCDILHLKGLLHHTNRIKIEEQLAIFLFIIGHNLRTRAVQELFRYSGETISRHFNNVLNAIMAISLDFFQPPNFDVPPEILEDPRFYPYFKDCVGTIDGFHIPVMVGVDEQGPFRNKNGQLSQRVLVACSFDLKFHYVLAGWEGSASDLRLLYSALTRRNRLQIPEGKYYLVDNKYANMPGFITPYSGVSYHLNEDPSGYHPQDARELFNQRHLLLQNATDRIFGSLKARFPILTSAPPYPLQTQVKLVVVACALHNFIRMEKPDDWLFKMYEHGAVPQGEESMPPLQVEPSMHVEMLTEDVPFGKEELEFTSQLRDSIATEMWDDYIHDISTM
ncbi:putative nuclease HARBI1 [Tripterygium wilfordii]|uniref:putative nuclease HARBI1 n=1 Tax=Tripterygium wilfordii TaxID=458696 RepID=UPI0018F833AC|nr:putative nuclease HARBI1 [Tripterygium wilfordii]